MATLMVACVGFLAGVRSQMYSQGAPLDEAFVAVLEHASIRSFVGVYPMVSAEVRSATEGLDD